MAKTVDELIIKIQADTSDLRKQLNNIQGKLNMTGRAGAMAFGAGAGGAGFGAALSKIPKSAMAAAAGIAAVAVGISKVAQVGSGFEDLKDSLDTVFGGMKQGQQAMDRVMKFAQTTPFQIEDVTKAFIQLKSSGVEPSEDMLQAFADTASTSIDQLGAFEAMVRLVQRSAAGGLGLEEINMLDDRGIPATKMLTEALGKSRDELSEFGSRYEGRLWWCDGIQNG
jgi:tape measure domain-containing protein